MSKRSLETLPLLHRLLSPAIAHRGLVLSSLVLVERLLTPTATWALFERDLPAKLAFGLALGIVFAGRIFAQHTFKARTEADLLERLVSHLIDGDVLRANVLPDADARAELPHAVYNVTQVVAVDLPLLAADGVAAALLTILIVSSEPARLAGFAIATRARAWAAAGSRVAGEALVSNKLPLLAIAALSAAGAAVLGPRWRGTLAVPTAELALLASMTPAFSGVAQKIFAVARGQRWLGLVASVLAEPQASAVETSAPPKLQVPIAFEGVSFRYDGKPYDALHEVTLTWGQ